jgi:hypothetical protein
LDKNTDFIDNGKNEDLESQYEYGFDFILNEALKEVNVIKRIGLQNGNLLAIEVDSSLLLQAVEQEDVLRRTISPLRQRLEEGLYSYPKKKRLMIITRIMTFLNQNIQHIVDSQSAFVDNSTNADDYNDESELQVLYNLAVTNDLAGTVEFDSPTIPLHLRVAWGDSKNRAEPGRVYYDMTDDKGRVVEISQRQGWKILSGSNIPILFRKHNQIPQVEPDRNYEPNIFNQFVSLTNIKNKRSEQLIKVYIVSLLIPDIAHPILTSYGPKGAAKSFLLKLIKMLVDPSTPVLLSLQKSRDEFIQQINHNYLAFYDNVKFIPYWLSDEICKTITGIGHTKRALYSDDDDIVYEHKHCVSLNGINVSLTEPDALDRSIFAELEDIDDESRKREEEVLAKFESIKPKLLAYLFDVVSKAMQIKSTLRLTRLSRMADFTEWGEAISRALEYPEMSFVDAYNENRNEQNIMAVNEDITGSLFVKFFNNYESEKMIDPRFTGRPDELYRLLVGFAEQNEININYRQFPRVAEILIKKLKNIKSNLKEGFNIIVKIERDSGNCSLITIYRDEGKLYQNADVNKAYALQVIRNHLSQRNTEF